jgi:hypothetical protein
MMVLFECDSSIKTFRSFDPMDISALTLKLIILLIPGAIAYLIFQKLTISYKRKDSFLFIINSILFGAFIYVICALIFGKICGADNFISFWAQIKTDEIPFGIVATASGCALIIGYLAATIDNHKWINSVGRFLGTSNKYGDENLFSFFLSREDVQEVNIHDIASNLTYNGIIREYSESDEFKEIVLEDVKVYPYDDPDKGPSYSLRILYLVRPKDNLVIEVPLVNDQPIENEQSSGSKQTELLEA